MTDGTDRELSVQGESDVFPISLRRTIVMLEQSIKLELQAYMFAPNESDTWTSVESAISNFLFQQWTSGMLAGTTPAEAYSVSTGLGQTMTPDDILNGVMKVAVKVALERPAEFITLQFQQQMNEGIDTAKTVRAHTGPAPD